VANPRDFGPIYWHTLVYPVKPKELWERAETQEIDEPFRGGVGISIRLPLTRLAIVIGRWNARFDESQALTNAIRGRSLPEEEVDWEFIRYGAQDGDHV
jgi:hypothetical protein